MSLLHVFSQDYSTELYAVLLFPVRLVFACLEILQMFQGGLEKTRVNISIMRVKILGSRQIVAHFLTIPDP